MFKRFPIYIAVLAVTVFFVFSGRIIAQEKQKMFLDSEHLEVLLNPRQDIAWGNVIFRTADGIYYCDSAVWKRGESINMKGNVIIEEKTYKIVADSVFYDILKNEFIARGDHVELWSKEDSLFLVGRYAHYNRNTGYFFMEQRPTMFLKYPDTTNMVEVRGDFLEYDSETERAEASGRVIITTKDLSTLSGCAVMYPKLSVLDLSEKPRAKRGHSVITGEYMTITTINDIISRIDVIDSANGEFNEPVDSLESDFDKSLLAGHRIIFDFVDGELNEVTCFGQAYSWYYPAAEGKDKFDENTVSGDTIKFHVKNEKLHDVEVIGGSIGTYVSGERPNEADSVSKSPRIDTVDYQACYINYSLKDSVITLQCQGHVNSGQVELDAYKIAFDTKRRIIEAFSAETVARDTLTKEEFETLEKKYGPNDIPVILKDGTDELYGDYLEYSIDTYKGRIIQSRSNYEQGTYYGENAYRSRKDIFYVRNGRYTPCDINFLHFFSCNMKLLEKNKLIAKPVVMYVGRMPVLALPYYVFPLKKGRHSGFLPFTLGNIERGDRYIRNVGYYWAASDYWDIQSAVDYYERERTINFYNKVRYKKRYVYEGYISGNYTRETGYLYSTASESKSTR
ncbi:MAG: putative LPS assembly protein LptD, partial [Candidatus Zixiibacteriota bacterium]